MTSSLVSTPQVQACQALLAPSSPAQGGIGTAYIELAIDQQFFPNNSTSSFDLTSAIQSQPGFIPQCIEIVNPCGCNIDVLYQSGNFPQRMRVSSGFTSRRKIVFSSTPFVVFLSWNNQISGVASPFVAANGSLFRIRVYNFPLNDEDSSMWHFFGPLSFQIGGGTPIGQHIFWQPSDLLKMYKIRRIEGTIFNSTTTGSVNIGFFTSMYAPSIPVASSTGNGILNLAMSVPASWVQEFTLLDNMDDSTEALMLGPGTNFLGIYCAAATSANMVIACNLLIDMFDPFLGKNAGLIT